MLQKYVHLANRTAVSFFNIAIRKLLSLLRVVVIKLLGFVCKYALQSGAQTEQPKKHRVHSNSLIFFLSPFSSYSHHIEKFPFQLLIYRGEIFQQLDFFFFSFPLLSIGVNL